MARNWAIWWTLASITWSLHRRCCVYVWVCAYVRAAGCMCTRPRVFVGNGGSVWVYVCVWGRPWVRLLEWILNWSLKVTFVYFVKLIRFFGNYGFYFRFLSRFFSFFWLFTWCSDLANINACLHEFSFAFFYRLEKESVPVFFLFCLFFFSIVRIF